MRNTWKKAIFVCLAVVMMLSLQMLTAQAKGLPRTFDRNRANKFIGRNLELAVGGMRFYGKLTNGRMTEEDLERMVEEIMRQMGLDNDKFDALNNSVDALLEATNLTGADKQKMIDNIFDLIGAVPGVGTVSGIIQIFYQMSQGEYYDAGKSSIEAAYGFLGSLQEWEINRGDMPAGMTPWVSLIMQLYSMYKAGAMVAGEWVGEQQKYRDLADGLAAMRTLGEFYEKLDSEIADFMRKNKTGNRIDFTRSKCGSKVVTIFGVEAYETWELTMELHQTSDANTDFAGRSGDYEGEYTIKITYDLTQFPVVDSLKKAGMFNFREIESGTLHGGKLTCLSAENTVFTRTLTGNAKVTLDLDKGAAEAEFKPNEDKFGGEVMTADYYGVGYYDPAKIEVEYTYEFSFVKGYFKIELKKNDITVTLPEFGTLNNGPLGESVMETVTGDILERGDHIVAVNKKLTILP